MARALLWAQAGEHVDVWIVVVVDDGVRVCCGGGVGCADTRIVALPECLSHATSKLVGVVRNTCRGHRHHSGKSVSHFIFGLCCTSEEMSECPIE